MLAFFKNNFKRNTCSLVYEDEFCCCIFLDISQANEKGHTLVVPKGKRV